MAKIHPSSLVSSSAQIDSTVEIGPFCTVGPNVKIGRNTRIQSHAIFEGNTWIGENCVFSPGVCIGMPPQDKKYKDAKTFVKIGNNNIFREYVTVHSGSVEGSSTTIGDNNYIMVNCHVGHDSAVGNDIIMANACLLGGHVVVEDKAIIGGGCGIHQFVCVGKLSMVGALSKAIMDIPPFSMADGKDAKNAQVLGANLIGLRRAGYTTEEITAIKNAIKKLFISGLNLSKAAEEVREELGKFESIQYLLNFIQKSKRGIERGVVAEL